MAVKIFFCYAHEDEALLNKLKTQLRPFQRQGLIDVWNDRDISAGTEWEQAITDHLNNAQIILLLVSPDFIDSDYCYGTEMKKALERHKKGEARVIPVILRPVHWQDILGIIQALPTDGNPVASSSWHSPDDAFFNVAEGIRKVVEEITNKSSPFSWQCILTLTGHENFIWSVAISPDGQTLASGSQDNTIKLWNLKTGDLRHTLTGHEKSVYSVAISPDGQTLASGGEDSTIKLWEKK